MSQISSIAALGQPEERLRPADVFMREIADSIVSGRYAEDEVLPPEAPLGAHFQVSRTIVRESMKRLEEKGLVTIQQGRGTLVRPRARWNILDPLVLSAVIAHDEENHTLDELTLIRAALESLMARQTASASSNTDRDAVIAALQQMRDVEDDYEAFRDADAEFHRLVMRISGNFLAGNIADTLYSHARHFSRFEDSVDPDKTSYTLLQHQEITEAIVAGNAAGAETAMRHHILDAWRRRSGRNLL